MTTVVTMALVALAAGTAAGGSVDWAVAVFPSGAEFALEIAADPAAWRLGYMHRERVGSDEGMLFLFDGPGRHSIWMKNCRVSLDIIWLDATWEVVEIAHQRPPCPDQGECPGIAPMRVSRYVLEVAGGIARQHGLEIGDRIELLSEPPIRP